VAIHCIRLCAFSLLGRVRPIEREAGSEQYHETNSRMAWSQVRRPLEDVRPPLSLFVRGDFRHHVPHVLDERIERGLGQSLDSRTFFK
jgi:hypothetical protein